MLAKDLVFRNPLRLIGEETEDIISNGGFGALLARAGVGKTALLVQIALDNLLRNINVLHISLNDPVKKISLWYEQILRNIVKQYNIKQMDQLSETMLSHRFIMAIDVEDFSIIKLEQRLKDLMEQDVFNPKVILVDGLPFSESIRKPLYDFKTLIKEKAMQAWFTVRIHRHEQPEPNVIPDSFSHIEDLFESAIYLHPQGKEIRLKVLKGKGSTPGDSALCLDPSSMMIKINS